MNGATELENSFYTLAPGQRTVVSRRRQYDPEYGLLHLAGTHSATPVRNGPSGYPTPQWVREALLRGVVGDELRPVPFSRPPARMSAPHAKRIDISAFAVDRYVEASEDELVFGGLVDNLIGDPSRPVGEKLQSILSERALGNTANRRNIDPSHLEARVNSSLAQQAPVQLVLPAMPFKDQCPFRTDAPADHVDLGELAFIVRLHCLVLAINQIHPFDAECVVVSDGVAYAPIFDVSTDAARRYVARLRQLRNQLNFSRTVHFVDLADLVKLDTTHAGSGLYRSVPQVRRVIRNRLEKLVREDPQCERAMSVLAYGMRWNLNTRKFLTAHSPTTLWSALRRQRVRGTESSDLVTLSQVVQDRAWRSALDYLSFNLAVAYCQLFDRYFPEAIRLTSHPKVGQVAAPRLGNVYPWNGVAVVADLAAESVTANSVTSTELHSALRAGLVPVFRQGETYPICYTRM